MSSRIRLPKGEIEFLVRSLRGSRLTLDGTNNLIEFSEVPLPKPQEGRGEFWRIESDDPAPETWAPGHRLFVARWRSDGESHDLACETVLGTNRLRHDLGVWAISWRELGQEYARLLAPHLDAPQRFSNVRVLHERLLKSHERLNRNLESEATRIYWRFRRNLATELHGQPADYVAALSRFLPPASQTNSMNDLAFLRRLSLATTGRIPRLDEIRMFTLQDSSTRRKSIVDYYLTSPEWADGWLPYWQHLLAENPRLLKPSSQNTGPFRFWLHDALSDNLPLDRLITDLINLHGDQASGASSGFLRTDSTEIVVNRTSVLLRATEARNIECAVCHDSPYSDLSQFSVYQSAAMMANQRVKLPERSVGPIQKAKGPDATSRRFAAAQWPFEPTTRNLDLNSLLQRPTYHRDRLAAILTNPENTRFAEVMVNRLWTHYFGKGIREPVDDYGKWGDANEELLSLLAKWFIASGYDMRALARLILNSQAFHDLPRGENVIGRKPNRRMTAEQLLDSLFVAVGKQFDVEPLNLDVDLSFTPSQFPNLGTATRAWQLALPPLERNRLSISLPRLQMLTDFLIDIGWTPIRSQASSADDRTISFRIPAALSNAPLINGRISRLSDDGSLANDTRNCSRLEDLVSVVFLRTLTRLPDEQELSFFVGELTPGFQISKTPRRSRVRTLTSNGVSWSNHLRAEAADAKRAEIARVAAGDPATASCEDTWRKRFEDLIWALINSNEFFLIP